MSGTGLYAYAVTRAVGADVSGQQGIGDAPLRLVEVDGLGVAVSEVDLDEFGEDGLRRNLEDLRWLETVAVAHDRVARHLAERAPTAPLRLATVFLGEDSLRARLAEWRDDAERALDRIDGRSEWSVKAYVDTAAAPAEQEHAPTAGGGAGRAYLMRRRAATQQREAAAAEDAHTAGVVHEALAAVAVAGRRLPAQDRQLTGHTGEMVLNGTYLVDDTRVEEFRATVDRLAEAHPRVRVEVGGPWPPYSFAGLEST